MCPQVTEQSSRSDAICNQLKRRTVAVCLTAAVFCLFAVAARSGLAQGGQTLFGEVRIDASQLDKSSTPPSVTLVLYREGGGEVGRQSVSNRSRYRFINLVKGDYQLAIEADNNEISRLRIVIRELSQSPYGFQQDLILALKPPRTEKAGVLATADLYNRSGANKTLFRRAQEVIDKKHYAEAGTLLQQIVESDKLDFQAWTLLGIVRFKQEDFAEAEKAYLSALAAKPTFVLALLNLGKLHLLQKNYEAAISPLLRAVEAQPQSAEANLLLGEAYLQTRRGTKAIPYLNEAAKLGRPEAHLRLGWLFNAAGMKEKAVAEYETFLKKMPDYSDRKKLQEYIDLNKK